MGIERVLGTTPAGPMLGGLTWRPPAGGKHTMRRLHEARNLTTDASHYTVCQSEHACVYGLYQPRPSEEVLRLPKGVFSAAHCFANIVAKQSPNAALILSIPPGDTRRDERTYIVVLEDGVPVVDALTSETEALNALGSDDRPIWSDNTTRYMNAEPVDFDWLAKGATKSSRVLAIPMNPWPFVIATVAIVTAAGVWFGLQQARKAEAARQMAEAAAAADPVPKYLAALALRTPTMASNREQLVAAVQKMFDAQVHVPGWNMTSIECSAAQQQCVSAWTRKGGTFEDLRRARPNETLQLVSGEGQAVPLTDRATTRFSIQVGRTSLLDPAKPLTPVPQAILDSGPLWQVWKTAGLSIDLKQPTLWPAADGVPPGFTHPAALHSGAIQVANVPGPFLIEALRGAPAWVSWEHIRADIGDGDIKTRLSFTATGAYYAAGR